MVVTVCSLVIFFFWTGMAVNFVAPPCDQNTFDSNVDSCLSDFNQSLEVSDYQDRCPWPAVKSNYNKLKHCVDDWVNVTWCMGQGSLVDDIFLRVHHTYFSACGQVQDPPFTVVILLIAPVTLAALLMPLICVKLTPSIMQSSLRI